MATRLVVSEPAVQGLPYARVPEAPHWWGQGRAEEPLWKRARSRPVLVRSECGWISST